MKKTLLKTLLLTCLLSVWGVNAYAQETEVTDAITPEAIGYTSGTAYTDVTYTGTSGTIYAGHLIVKEGYIQMRSSSSDTGLWTTGSIGYARKIDITWNTTQSSESRTLDIYGNSTPYSAASDLYNSSTQGTRIAQITNDNTTATLEITGDYPYIAFRSNSGALYLAEIDITWEEAEIVNPEPEPEPSGHGYEPDDPYSASEAKALIAALEAGETISDIYVKGTISQIDEVSTTYGNATYWISDDGTTDDQLEIYRGYYLENTSFTSEDAIKIGDEVIVYGTFVLYSGSSGNVPQGQTGNTYIYSLNGDTEAPGEEHNGEVDIEGTTVDLVNPNVTAGTESTSVDFTTIEWGTDGSSGSVSVDGQMFTFDDGSTVTFAKADGSTAPTWYDNGSAIRVYANNTLTFSSSKVIAKIEMHCYSTYEGNQSTEVVDFSEDGLTAVYCNAGTTTTQLRVQSITIYYEGEGGDTGGTTIGGLETFENGSFEEWDGNYPVGWHSTTTASNHTITQSTDAYDGQYSAQIPHTSSSNERLASKEYILPAGTYNVSFYAKSVDSSAHAHISAGYTDIDSDGNANSNYTYIVSNQEIGDNWENVTFTFTLTNETELNLVIMDRSGSDYGDVLIDLYSIEQATGTFTISSADYATYYTDVEYTMPDGVTGTTVTGVEDVQDDGGYLLDMAWGYTAGSTVPAGTALVLKGEAGTYTYTITNTEAAAPTDNLLMGSITSVETYGPEENGSYLYYELTNGQYGIGFYWGADDGEAFTSGANKAWLALTTTQAQNARFLGFGDGDDTTGISSVENATESATVKGIYTIQGVRVSNMNQPGLYIVDGRKVLKR